MTSVIASIIIPTFDEATIIKKTLNPLQGLRQQGVELVLVDGGSTDNTLVQAESLVDNVVHAPKGRARQMNEGAKAARGKWLLFLHADTQLPEDIGRWLLQLKYCTLAWGFFVLRLDGKHWFFRCIEFGINKRSRITHVATGDQCLFVQRVYFKQIGRFPDIPLMEDVAICKQLRAVSKPLIWRSPALTSSRRWEQNGMLKTMFLMWRLRLAYFMGVDPKILHSAYYE